jgi:hypothetical protein
MEADAQRNGKLYWKDVSLWVLVPVVLALLGAVWSYHSGAFMREDFEEYRDKRDKEVLMLEHRVNSLSVEIGKIGRDVTYIREAVSRLEDRTYDGFSSGPRMHQREDGSP